MMQMNPPDDWLKTGWARDSQTRTQLVDSLICVIDRSLENNAFSVLHYVINVALHYTLKGVFVWENPNPDFRIQKRIMNP